MTRTCPSNEPAPNATVWPTERDAVNGFSAPVTGRPAWISREMRAMQRRRQAVAEEGTRARKIATLRAKACQMQLIAATASLDVSDRCWRATNAAVSLRLLAALAECHDRPPPDYDDGLSDLSTYHWQDVAAEERMRHYSAFGSPAGYAASFGSAEPR